MCINSASLLSLIYFVFRLFLPHYGSHFLLLLSSNFLLCAGHYGWFVVKSWIWCLFCKEYWVFSSRQFILAVSLILLRPDLSLSGRCLAGVPAPKTWTFWCLNWMPRMFSEAFALWLLRTPVSSALCRPPESPPSQVTTPQYLFFASLVEPWPAPVQLSTQPKV